MECYIWYVVNARIASAARRRVIDRFRSTVRSPGDPVSTGESVS